MSIIKLLAQRIDGAAIDGAGLPGEMVVHLPLRATGWDEELTIPHTPHCEPWCVRHCVTDCGEVTFCMGEDLPVYVKEHGGQGYVGLVQYPGEQARIDIGLAGISDVIAMDEAEQIAKQIMRQIDRARGESK